MEIDCFIPLYSGTMSFPNGNRLFYSFIFRFSKLFFIIKLIILFFFILTFIRKNPSESPTALLKPEKTKRDQFALCFNPLGLII